MAGEEITMIAEAGVDALVNRLHDDPEFRYAFDRDPRQCLGEFDFSDGEKELIAKKDQGSWEAYERGRVQCASPVCVAVVVVVANK
jgi:hypothetical protein